jgi:arylsulfatase A-like enzyme
LGQHGIYGHGGLHEAVTHIPLIIWGPKAIPRAKRISGYAQHVDLAPTILALIGAAGAAAFNGTNLLPLIESGAAGRRELVLEDEEQRALLSHGWKYIYDYEERLEALYDLATDPMEVVNLAETEPARKAEMRAALETWVDTNLAGRRDPLPGAIANWRSTWKQQLGSDFPLSEKPTL